MKYLYILGAVVIISILTTASKAQAIIPDTAEMLELGQHAKHNSAMLTIFSSAITTCTEEVSMRTFTHWNECFKIAKDFDAALTTVFTNNVAGIKALSPYGSLLTP